MAIHNVIPYQPLLIGEMMFWPYRYKGDVCNWLELYTLIEEVLSTYS